MKTVGIIGGSTHIATVEYYNLINQHVREELGGLHTGEIIINSMDLYNSERFVHGELWDEGAEYLHGKAQSLERAGADFIICVSNTWHRVSDKFMQGLSIPLLHIADPTAEAVKKGGHRKVALLGTKATMSSPYLPDLFASRHGLEIIVPDEKDQTLIDDVIFKELSFNQFTDKSRQAYLEIVDKLAGHGAQGVILGCTEIPLLISQSDRPEIPMFDTLRLHAKAAAMEAVYGRPNNRLGHPAIRSGDQA
jgi:aspartate racemase